MDRHRAMRALPFIAAAALIAGLAGVAVVSRDFINSKYKLIHRDSATWPATLRDREKSERAILWFFHNLMRDSDAAVVELGAILAAEETCHLSYNQAAIKQYIAETVPASEMSFVSSLRAEIVRSSGGFVDLSPSAVAALCTQTERAARYNRFID